MTEDDANLDHIIDYAYLTTMLQNTVEKIKNNSEIFQKLLRSNDRFAFRNFFYQWMDDFDQHDFELFATFILLSRQAAYEDMQDSQYNVKNYKEMISILDLDTEGGIIIDK